MLIKEGQMENSKLKQEVLSYLDKGFLLSPDFVSDIDETTQFPEEIFESNLKNNKGLLILNKDLQEIMSQKSIEIFNWREFEKSLANYEKQKNIRTYNSFIEYLKKQDIPLTKTEPLIVKEEQSKEDNEIKVIFSYREESKKRTVQDFIGLFNIRYKSIEGLLKNRRGLQGISSINRIKSKSDREEVSLIGMVMDKQITKNKNIILSLEDLSGTINVLVSKNKPEVYSLVKDIILDETIGVTGVCGKNIVFANNILLPEIPSNRELKKSATENYFVVLSDLHVGSTNFLAEEFDRFLQWINGEIGNEKQKELASKIGFLFILGDLVDGVGVYPEQNTELVIKDIFKQYEVCAEYLRRIPSNIKIIIIPGNHDAMRLAEPQPELYKDLAAPIWALPNVTLLSNPSYVNILSSKDFPGFDFLLYHGYSFTYYADIIESIRSRGGVDKGDLIMKFLLQRRHLAPTHKSTLYLPNANNDALVIDKVPDFFLTGHLHKSVVANYKNITLICGSCWQSKTTFMEKLGIHPEPAKVPVVNLHTREVKVLRFGK
ncbi:hypothetical protein A3K72_04225 [Candidatus Woesearchaeota archaeon RBG_13_36_6]|nr:MAG: hypothetical protein A3K72_04225 [Candidatus Woesearchaeota archaeon RBG_13_36_6]